SLPRALDNTSPLRKDRRDVTGRDHVFDAARLYNRAVTKRDFNEKHTGRERMRSAYWAVLALGAALAAPQASAQGVKIGILNDQSGVYADYGGKWSFEAAKMAVEDLGGGGVGREVDVNS